jgi:hypothetical protein
VVLVEFLNENLRQPHEHIQLAASAGLRQMLFSFFPVAAGSGPSERLQLLTVLKYMEGLRVEANVAVTRGYALALGALPPKLVTQPAGRLKEVFDSLGAVASPSWRIAGEADVETRRNAVESIVELGEKLVVTGALSDDSGVAAAHVIALLLSACEDYSVDKRGDTGSWCRIAGMKGLHRLVLAALRAPCTLYPRDQTAKYSAIDKAADSSSEEAVVVGSHVLTVYGHALVEEVMPGGSLCVSYPPHSFGAVMCSAPRLVFKRKGVELIGQSAVASSDQEFHLPAAPERKAAMLTAFDGTGLAEITKSTAAAISGDDAFSSRWDPQALQFAAVDQSHVHKVVGVLLKQLGEKLDAVRDVAGGILASLVRSTDPRICILPDRRVLQGALAHIENKVAASATAVAASATEGSGASDVAVVKWTQPKFVYSFLTGILDSNHYFAPVIGGLVISIGGLSEGIAKESLAALLHWCNVQRAAKNMRDLSLLAATLVALFRQHARDSRVVMPLLKCLSALLRNGIFDFLYSMTVQKDAVGSELHRLVTSELNKCGEIAKIRAGIDLYLLLLMFDDPVRPAALKSLLFLTGHKYPKVRKYAAEQLYVVLISDPLAVGPSREDVAAAMAEEEKTEAAGEREADRPRRRSGIARSEEASQQASDILTSTLWEDSVPAVARERRARLCEVLGVEMKVSVGGGEEEGKSSSSSSKKKKKPAKEDELDSYDALVREAGNISLTILATSW